MSSAKVVVNVASKEGKKRVLEKNITPVRHPVVLTMDEEVKLRIGNLQSYWTSTKLSKLTVVLKYRNAIKAYSRIEPPPIYGNLRSY